MNNPDAIEPHIIISEAKALLNAAWHTSSEERHAQLILWARETLQPLAIANEPEALWLLCSMPQNTEQIDEDEFERRHMLEIRAAAEAGSTSAMFFLACELYQEPTYEESSKLFKTAAEQGHTYSKWCHGLNLLSGCGIEKDVTLGLKFIEAAGNEKFEGAIQFLAHAYAEGTHGYPKDEAA